MSMDTSRLAHPKGDSVAEIRKAKKKADAAEWRRVCRKVDKRDGRVCQVTGVKLESGHDDPWRDLARHHLEYRSLNKKRRNDVHNVWTVSSGIHDLIHARKLFVLDKDWKPAKDVREIFAVTGDGSQIPLRLANLISGSGSQVDTRWGRQLDDVGPACDRPARF